MSEDIKSKEVETEIIHSPFAADEECPYIFISYAHADRERIFPIITKLYEKGWRIWYDQGLTIGGDYYDCLAEHIENCAAVLLMATKNAVESKFVTDNELKYAAKFGKRIVICQLDKGAELPRGIELATADEEKHPRCKDETLEQTLESINGLERGEPREAVGIKINEPAELIDTALTEDDDYERIVVNGGVRLTKYLGSDTKVVIPSYYKGKRVVELDETFSNNTKIRSVTIPDSVTSIGHGAFEGCSSLASVTIPGSVTSIGDWAFFECSSLASVTIPDSVTSIGYWAFRNCSCNLVIRCAPNSAVQRYAVKNKLAYETDEAVNTAIKASEAKAKDVPEKKQKYVYVSYDADKAEQSSEIVAALKKRSVIVRTQEDADSQYELIGMLNECACFVALVSNGFIEKRMTEQLKTADSISKPFIIYKLEDCDLPSDLGFKYDSIQQLRYDSPFDENIAKLISFASENGCVDFRIPFEYTNDERGITVVKWRGDEHEAVIEREYGGVPVVSIGNMAFSNCSSLASVTIPASVTSIGDWAFNGCSSLTSVTIPDSVTSIGNGAFNGCSSLASVTIPDSVTSIGTGAFAYCSSLASVTIPDSVTSIGEYAFKGCHSPLAWLLPLILVLLAAGAAWYFGIFEKLLGLLG